jgi:hypothetical protein
MISDGSDGEVARVALSFDSASRALDGSAGDCSAVLVREGSVTVDDRTDTRDSRSGDWRTVMIVSGFSSSFLLVSTAYFSDDFSPMHCNAQGMVSSVAKSIFKADDVFMCFLPFYCNVIFYLPD